MKEMIADEGQWALIPGVNPDINSVPGDRRMQENASLFSFIDNYFPDGPFAFEPTFPFGANNAVTLEGDFLDKVNLVARMTQRGAD